MIVQRKGSRVSSLNGMSVEIVLAQADASGRSCTREPCTRPDPSHPSELVERSDFGCGVLLENRSSDAV